MSITLFFQAWGCMAVLMGLLWLRQLKTKNATSVDVAWAAGFALVAVVTVFRAWTLKEGQWGRVVGVASLTSFWSLRLASHLYVTRVRGHEHEDGRYAQLRLEWSQLKFFIFYQAQGLLTATFSIPVMVAMLSPNSFPAFTDGLGLFIAALAIVGESIADSQLARHRARPESKGLTCRVGLWRYSRHPNYFFEWTHWFAYVAIAASSPQSGLTLIGPALMLFLMFKITGIPPTEEQALKSRRDYADYQRTTSVFFPWFPKKS